jgi:hypothetical protein
VETDAGEGRVCDRINTAYIDGVLWSSSEKSPDTIHTSWMTDTMTSITSSTAEGGASAALRRSTAVAAYAPPQPRDAPISSDTARADDPPAVVVTLTRSFSEMVAKRTSDFGAELTETFAFAAVPIDEPVTLALDMTGAVRSTSADDRIDALFAENPRLVEEFRSISTLNALDAMQQSNRLSEDERRTATSRANANAARDRHTARSFEIQSRAGTLTLAAGTIVSAAMEFINDVPEASKLQTGRNDQ